MRICVNAGIGRPILGGSLYVVRVRYRKHGFISRNLEKATDPPPSESRNQMSIYE